ncbi:amino acid ABC transporter permease [Guptibacillus algicola]|uniref:amino acid ABC transporter permease n=1 Tax=Guptibacillus algicola TaxID=225844 RepID=UPI001CD318D6|nr:amino acid ABC transporter permease [Alkalihalobacillus algicola]MCA0987721.1 amino acid ABC transporter permease [Alkalihalobacillus algicola]
MGTFQPENLFDADLALRSFPYVIEGLGLTMLIAVVGMLVGLFLGLFLALGRMSKVRALRWPARLYISFMRGTPILVFLYILYFGLPMAGIEFSAITAALIGFSLNSSAYIAEIQRSALSSIEKGQWEASTALGMSYWQTMREVVLPQATRIAIPPLSNVMLDLIKASSLAAVITVPELLHHAQIVGGREFDFMTLYILVAFIYWGVCVGVSFLQELLEKRYYYVN